MRHGGSYSWRVLCKAPAYSYSIPQTLDEKGKVVSAQNYYVFGSISESYDNSDTYGIYKFTGKERDKESDYNYFNISYYDADLIRWHSVDLLG